MSVNKIIRLLLKIYYEVNTLNDHDPQITLLLKCTSVQNLKLKIFSFYINLMRDLSKINNNLINH